jgi:predicted peroxiredoxin
MLKEKIQKHKLGIIVPYRNRPTQLKRFVSHMEDYIKDLDYEIFIIEQSDDKPFNRGKLLNVGYKYAIESGCDYFVFHDVDMLPEDVDYSYSDKPLHLATHLQEHDYETTFFDYFGGVTMFNKEDFETINGFSNEYWGWGFEDDDLLIRCIESDLELDTTNNSKKNIQEFEAFEFKGEDSYIKIKNKEQKSNLLEDDFSISVLVKPSNIKIDENDEYDEYPILSIPGYNIGLFYNSFRRFFCQSYDLDKTPYSITTDILGEQWVHLTMVYSDGDSLSLYVNDTLIETIKMDKSILELNSNEIFVGAASEEKENKDFFYGMIASVEIYDIALDKEEIIEITKNPLKPKLRNFGKFKSSEFLYTQLLAELSNSKSSIDLSNQNEVSLKNIYLYKTNQSFNTFLPTPCRRNSRFKSLEHKSNSSIENTWVHKETRKNQIKYYNEIREDFSKIKEDGLNSLEYLYKEEIIISEKIKKISIEL